MRNRFLCVEMHLYPRLWYNEVHILRLDPKLHNSRSEIHLGSGKLRYPDSVVVNNPCHSTVDLNLD